MIENSVIRLFSLLLIVSSGEDRLPTASNKITLISSPLPRQICDR